MTRAVRAIRVFFNTYYEESAEKILSALKSLGYDLRVERSRVVPELYYVDVRVEDNLEEAKKTVEEVIRRAADDTVFGIKVYVVDASR
ncbi:hypothetical protein [Hyperthermus butylicus]|uniref:Uncharacterized protein n=1 Tax=Hyperthermus butylicus (strain DSM 5456 / JCM 9403 / PLM1-5) TaxID=415426 RepID=A2BMB8_HYPBU|nr:hypothetical protein [Hyperthermus butylicus]ABM81129.1 hypothetical protein Hbut_1299 [Hyperthermus butylicus DSM 5456]